MDLSDVGRANRRKSASQSSQTNRNSVKVRLIFDGPNIRAIKREYSANRALYVIIGYKAEVHMTERELRDLGASINKYFEEKL